MAETTANSTLTEAKRRGAVPTKNRATPPNCFPTLTQLLQGHTHAQLGPRNNVPTLVRTTASIRNNVMTQNESGLELSQLRKPRAGRAADSVASNRRIATTKAGTRASQACTRTSSTLSARITAAVMTIRIGLRRNH